MEKKTKPLFISTPRGDKSPFDDFWKIKRSELETFAKMYREQIQGVNVITEGKQCKGENND